MQKHIGKLQFILSMIVLLLIFISESGFGNGSGELKSGMINFDSLDGLKMTADLYLTEDITAPLIIMYHKTCWSRGEFTEIAPRLVENGYNCLAVDHRAGKRVNSVQNETTVEAVKKKLSREIIDALPDLEASLFLAKEKLKPRKIIILGSSFFASMVFILAYRHPDKVDGILAFSPSEYFEYEEKQIKDLAKKITCPVFITSKTIEKEHWQPIFDNLPGDKKTSFLPPEYGKHGAEALWKVNKNNGLYWAALLDFLKKYFKTK